MKKLTRKMIPAFAMLLVSAVLMSTASFAWFSMNAEVTASGITVTATAPAALWISDTGNAGSWVTNINMTKKLTTAAELSPVTIPDSGMTNAKWDAWQFYILNSQIPVLDEEGKPVMGEDGKPLTESAYGKVLANGSINGVTNLTYPTTADDKSGVLVWDNDGTEGDTVNFFKTYFWLYLEGGEGEKMTVNVQAKVSCTNTKDVVDAEGEDVIDPIYQAMRIALVGKDGNVVVFEPSELDTFIKVGTADKQTDSPELLEITAGVPTQFAVYVWFEGTDGQCINANSINSQIFGIDFSFT